MKKLTIAKQNEILALNSSEKSLEDIAKLAGVSKITVRKKKKKKKIKHKKLKSGRKELFQSKTKQLIIRLFKNKELKTLPEAVIFCKKNFDLKISTETIRKILLSANIKCHKKIKKPHLTKKHIKNRKKFAKSKSKWSFFDWSKIIFSDESKFNLHGSDGISNVWCCDEDLLKQENIQSIKKFGGGSVMVWGCITSQGVGKLLRIESTINSKDYCKILLNGLIPTMLKYNLSTSNSIFQQDNASCHASRETQDWLRINNIPTLEWPANSPDMNPIENVWAYLDKKVRKNNASFTDPDLLWKELEKEWYDIDPELIKSYFFSMCSRIAALKKSKGDVTKY